MDMIDGEMTGKYNTELPKKIRYDRDCRVPLIFSVSGHRSIRKEDYRMLFNRLCIFFKAYKKKYSHTPMMLMTPLAEGGDIIATYAALEAGFIICPVLLTDEVDLCNTFVDVGGISKEDYSDLVNGIINNYPYHITNKEEDKERKKFENIFFEKPTDRKGFKTENLSDLFQRELNGIKLSEKIVKKLWDNVEECRYESADLLAALDEPLYKKVEGPTILSKCTLHTKLFKDDKIRYNSQFKDVNAYLIANSHIVVALWDGYSYDYENGGTFNAIYMAFNGIGYKHIPYSHPMSPVTDLPEKTNETMLKCVEDCPIYWIKVRNSDERIIDRRVTDNTEQVIGHDRGEQMFDIDSEGIYIVPKMIGVDEEDIKIDDDPKKEPKRKSTKKKGFDSRYDGNYKGASCEVRCCARYIKIEEGDRGKVRKALISIPYWLLTVILVLFTIVVPIEGITKFIHDTRPKRIFWEKEEVDPETIEMILELYGHEGMAPKKESFDKWADSLKTGDSHIKVNPLSSDEMSKEMSKRMYGILPRYYQKIFEKIDALNNDIERMFLSDRKEMTEEEKEKAANKWRSRYYLLDSGKDSSVSEEMVDKIRESHAMEDMAMRYNVADTLAGKKDKIYMRWMIFLIVIALFSAISFKYYILLDGALLFMFVYVSLLFLTKLILYIRGERKTFRKFIEYRSLAETLRVQYYWGLLKINENATAAGYGYMKNQTDWIRSVMRSWNSYFMNIYSMSNSIHKDKSDDETRSGKKGCCLEDDAIDVVRECWIKGQKRYHRRKEKENKKALKTNSKHYKFFETLTEILAITALIAGIVFNEFFQQTPLTIDEISINGMIIIPSYQFKLIHLLKVVMIVTVALTAFFLSMKMRIRGGTPDQIKAKYRMFAIAEMRLRDIDNQKSVDIKEQNRARFEIMKELGEQCIAENNDWVFEHTSKDFKKGKTSDSVMDDNLV